MRSDILIAIGVIVILQLSTIGGRVARLNRQLEAWQKKLDDGFESLKGDLQSIEGELQWHKPHTFANALGGWINEAAASLRGEFQSIRDEFKGQYTPNTFANNLRVWIDKAAESIKSEFQWHKDLTFAHSLRHSIETSNEDLAREIRTGNQDLTNALETVTNAIHLGKREVMDSLSAIEGNTSKG